MTLLRALALLLALCLASPALADEAVPAPHDDMVVVALSLIGTPYHYGGASPEAGFDCSGLVRYILGLSSPVTLPRTSYEMYHMAGHAVSLAALKAGDLLFFRLGKSRRVNHVAVYIGEDRFVHAPATGSAVRVDRLDDTYWRRFLLGARRVLPANDGPDGGIDAQAGSDASSPRTASVP